MASDRDALSAWQTYYTSRAGNNHTWSISIRKAPWYMVKITRYGRVAYGAQMIPTRISVTHFILISKCLEKVSLSNKKSLI